MKSTSVIVFSTVAGCNAFQSRRKDASESRKVVDVEVEPQNSPAEIQIDAFIQTGKITKESPAKVRFTIRNAGSRAVRLTNGAPAPLGILYGHETGKNVRNLIWSEEYERNKNIRTEGGHIKLITDAAEIIELGPNQEIEREYLFRSTDWEYQSEISGKSQTLFEVLNQDGEKVSLNEKKYDITIKTT